MKQLRIKVGGKTYDVEVELLNGTNGSGGSEKRAASNPVGSARVGAPVAAPVRSSPAQASAPGAVASPLSAVVVSIDVAVGDSVEAGQKVLTLEAMKMNTLVQASASGVVQSIEVAPGDAVEEGQALLVIE